jgi:GT2 family glycosyltransferase
MNSTILFSVIIPTYHRNDLLAKCLDCLIPEIQTLPAEQYEVIVTDDGFETTAEEMIKNHYPWVKWLAGKGKGPAANRNNGAKFARGEWLAFTDDDCLPDTQWLEAYAEAMDNRPDYQVFEGRTYVDRPQKSLAEISPINESGGHLWSCNFSINKKLFEVLGGFDERFPYAAMEDVEIQFRLKKAGHSFSFVKSASVCHPWRKMNFSKNGWETPKGYKESTFIYLYIHPEEIKRINTRLYLKIAIRTIFKTIIPGIFQFKLRGLKEMSLYEMNMIRMAFLLLNKSF